VLNDFLFFLVFLLVIASLTREEFAFTMLYLFAGALLLSRWWSKRTVETVSLKRVFEKWAFIGEKVAVKVVINNSSRLPVLWLRIAESVPPELKETATFQTVFSLSGRSHTNFEYQLLARKRGYYGLGPVNLSSGDILGIGQENSQENRIDYLTVYPKVVPLPNLGLPSRMPMGTLRDKQPIFEDPTRPIGKREYTSGDSLRSVDWKTSAAVGRLQVKKFEPAIDLETAIFLNLNTDDYPMRTRIDATELAIVAAASIANWVKGQKQAVGLWVNGGDVVDPKMQAQPVAIRKGKGHLMRILEVLARAQMIKTEPFHRYLRNHCANLGWGTTIILITGGVDDTLIKEMLRAKRSGSNAILILCGHVPQFNEMKRRVEHFDIPVYQLQRLTDMDSWRKVK
jgi:uncharacterized protein (DUF58 family)